MCIWVKNSWLYWWHIIGYITHYIHSYVPVTQCCNGCKNIESLKYYSFICWLCPLNKHPVTFIQFECISLTFAFNFDAFKSLSQNFSLDQIHSKFQNFGLGDDECWKIQYLSYLIQLVPKNLTFNSTVN